MEKEAAIPDEFKPVFTDFIYQVWLHHRPPDCHYKYTEDERSCIVGFLKSGDIGELAPRHFLLANLVQNRHLMGRMDVQSAYMLCGEDPDCFPISSENVNVKRCIVCGYFEALLERGSIAKPESLIAATFEPGKCRDCRSLWEKQPPALQSLVLPPGDKLKNLVINYRVPPWFCEGGDKLLKSSNVHLLKEMLLRLMDQPVNPVVVNMWPHSRTDPNH